MVATELRDATKYCYVRIVFQFKRLRPAKFHKCSKLGRKKLTFPHLRLLALD